MGKSKWSLNITNVNLEFDNTAFNRPQPSLRQYAYAKFFAIRGALAHNAKLQTPIVIKQFNEFLKYLMLTCDMLATDSSAAGLSTGQQCITDICEAFKAIALAEVSQATTAEGTPDTTPNLQEKSALQIFNGHFFKVSYQFNELKPTQKIQTFAMLRKLCQAYKDNHAHQQDNNHPVASNPTAFIQETRVILDDTAGRKVLKVLVNLMLVLFPVIGWGALAYHKHKSGNWLLFTHSTTTNQLRLLRDELIALKPPTGN